MSDKNLWATGTISLVLGFVLSAFLVGRLIPWLKKLKFGQSIREEGPESHKVKQGTPTMGGIGMILAGLVALVLLKGVMSGLGGEPFFSGDLVLILLGFLGFGLVGFLDDFIKIRRHHNEGLTVKQKFACEILLAVAMAFVRVGMTAPGTTFFFPFFGKTGDFGIWAYPFVVFIVVAMTNAVNLTDGLDGLASSVTCVVSLAFALLTMGTGSNVSFLFSLILAGVCLGFLVHNHYPAKVFMGDTGSLALGGALAAIGLASGTELYLPLAGLIYVLEALSVILQVGYFKLTHGKRLFRMAPLHHHFELGGRNEKQVVTLFTLITAVMALVSVLADSLL